MLRCNFIQPSTSEKVINQRHSLLERLLRNPTMSLMLSDQLKKFKHYEPVTARFTQSPREQNLKSLKSYLSAIYLLSNQCFALK